MFIPTPDLSKSTSAKDGVVTVVPSNCFIKKTNEVSFKAQTTCNHHQYENDYETLDLDSTGYFVVINSNYIKNVREAMHTLTVNISHRPNCNPARFMSLMGQFSHKKEEQHTFCHIEHKKH